MDFLEVMSGEDNERLVEQVGSAISAARRVHDNLLKKNGRQTRPKAMKLQRKKQCGLGNP